jgi:hypothetical protein
MMVNGTARTIRCRMLHHRLTGGNRTELHHNEILAIDVDGVPNTSDRIRDNVLDALSTYDSRLYKSALEIAEYVPDTLAECEASEQPAAAQTIQLSQSQSAQAA